MWCALAPIKQIISLTLLNTNVLSPLSSSSGVGGRGRLGAPPGPITELELDDDPKYQNKTFNKIVLFNEFKTVL